MRIFKTKEFKKLAADIDLSDDELKIAVEQMNSNLWNANLGGNVYKKRIGIDGRGKSSGVRTIICFKKNEKAFFVYIFKKNDKDSLTNREDLAFKELSKWLFSLKDTQISLALKNGQIFEVQ